MPEKVTDPKVKNPNQELQTQLLSILYDYFGIITFLVCVGLLYVSWTYVINPKYNQIASGEELNKKNEEYMAKSQYLKQLNTLKETYDKLNKADIAKVGQIIDRENDSSGLYRELEYIVKSHNMTPVEIKPVQTDDSFEIVNRAGSSHRSDKTLPQTRVWRTTVAIEKAEYANLLRVLRTIEFNIRLMDVQSVSYDPVNKKATLELLTYHRK